jgi:hypothetical protein
MFLDATTKSLEIDLAGAITTTQLPYTIDWVELLESDMSVVDTGSGDGTTNSTTAVSVLAAPASGRVRKVTFLSVSNEDTVAAVLTVQLNNNGTTRRIIKVTLDVGDNLTYGA